MSRDDTNNSNASGNHLLSPPDAQAMDALVQAGWDGERVPAQHAARATKLAGLLRLLSVPSRAETTRNASAGSNLVDATIARLEKTAADETSVMVPDLTPDDEDAMDALAAAGFRVSRVPSSLRARAEKIDAMARLVAMTPAPGEVRGDLLAERTMARIDATPRRRENIEISGRAGGFRFSDLVSIAAVMLIGVSVIWPVLSTARTHAQRTACASNMSTLAGAFGAYAGDFNGSLPMAAGFAGQSWLNVGKSSSESNSANLYTLAKSGYGSMDSLACPGNSKACRKNPSSTSCDWTYPDEVSYSYQVIAGRSKPVWSMAAGTIILADRSPVIARVLRGEPWFESENSANHSGNGQWGLRTDGSGCWLDSPMNRNDNIWLPGVLEVGVAKIREQVKAGKLRGELVIKGNELPSSENDSFLGP